MATRTWTTPAGGSWNTGSNWSGGLAPAAGDDAVISLGGTYAITVPAGTVGPRSLNVSSVGATLSLAAGTILSSPSIALTSGTIQGGTVSSPGFLVGQVAGFAGTPVLDGVAVVGTVHVGSTSSSAEAIVRNGIKVTAAGGGQGIIELSSINGSGAQPTTLFFEGDQAWDGLAVVSDAGSRTVIQGRTLGHALTLGAGTDLQANGTLSVVSTVIAGQVHVGSAGILIVGDGSQSAASSFAASARISIASGGVLRLYKNITSAALTAFAGEVQGPVGSIVPGASSVQRGSAVTYSGSAVDYQGTIDNAGAILDLTMGGALAHVSRMNGTVIGGTLRNGGGAPVGLPVDILANVALVGAFKSTAGHGLLEVQGTFSVTNLDGSDGTLDLATVPTGLRLGGTNIPGVTTAGSTATLNHLTLHAASVIGFQPTTIGAAAVVDLDVAYGALSGTITNAGVINVNAQHVDQGIDINNPSYGPGNLTNAGTINVAAGASLYLGGTELHGTGTFVNSGTVTVAAGGTVSFGSGAAGQVTLSGTGDTVAFQSNPNSTASIAGFRAGDRITADVGSTGAASLALAGQVLTISQGGSAIATATLTDAGAPAYALSDFSLSLVRNTYTLDPTTIAVTTTHGAPATAPVVTAPTTPTTPVVTTPTTPVVTPPVITPTTPVVTTPNVPTTPTVPTSSEPYVAFTSTDAGMSGQRQMTTGGNGGPSYLQHTYIWDRPEGVAMRADAANSFIHGGPGQDALQVTSGTNVLDGGTGSNFMTGTVDGAGTDTFFTDARGSQVVWNTLINFHKGDAATLWGFDPAVSSYRWDASPSGAGGATGATLRANILGGAGRSGDGIDASITFAGMTTDQAKALVHTTGTVGAGNYLYFFNQGV